MKLTHCRVQNFRSIIDSGWVEMGDIAVIVGKNESGKTSFLKALWKLNPFNGSGYDINREWPSGRRKEKSPDKVVVEARFVFIDPEIAEIEALHESAKGITGVEVTRNYAGKYTHHFLPKTPSTEHSVEWVVDLLNDRLALSAGLFSPHFESQYRPKADEVIAAARGDEGIAAAVKLLPTLAGKLNNWVSPNQPEQEQDQRSVPKLKALIDQTKNDIETTPLMLVTDYVHQRLPVFIYMDDHRAFVGSAQLDEVHKRQKDKRQTAEDETIQIIMEMSGLDLEQEVKRANDENREQRMLDMNDASNTLTNVIAERWSQRKYEVMFQADGNHFMTFVKDVNGKALVPLEERSKGFQWFFSFDMKFMYETDGQFENAIILLDEPGLHLHAAAQRDLLQRMKAYAEKNQLVYTTHLPFMIDFKRLDNIYVAEEIDKNGTVVHKNWATADKDARFTLQAALGISWSQSLFVGPFNLIVEGVDDFWFLTLFSTMFEEAGQLGIDPRLVVTPAGGASKVAYVGTILKGQELNVAVLLDSDAAGRQAFEQLVHNWILQDKLVVMVGDAVGQKVCALEDLFGESYYLKKVNEAYAKETGQSPILLDAKTQSVKPLVDRVQDAFSARGLGDFNKGRVAKRIVTELGKAKLEKVDGTTVGNFRKVIDAINKVVASWK